LKSNLLHFSLFFFIGAVTGQLLFQINSARAESQPSFHIQQQWHLGGAAGWGPMLYEASSKRLYIPRTDRVVVINTETGKAAGEITGFVDARNVALDDAGRFGFVTDITDGTVGFVRVFDRSTFKLVSTIPVGRIPSAIVFDSVTKAVFAFSSRDRNASVIDTKTNTVTAVIPLPGKPHIAVTDRKGAIFVGLRGIGQMLRIDTVSRRVSATWPIAPCGEFTGLTMDAAHRQLLGSCVNRDVISVNADSGQVLAIGQSASGPGDLAFDSLHHQLISAASSGTLTVFRQESANQYTLQEKAATLPRAGTMALDPDTGQIYLVTAKFQQRPVVGKGMEEMESRLTPVPGSFVVLVVSP
jgi:YVTN family beta-propeller protein